MGRVAWPFCDFRGGRNQEPNSCSRLGGSAVLSSGGTRFRGDTVQGGRVHGKCPGLRMFGQLVESAWSQATSKDLQKQVGPCGGRTASVHRVRLRALSRHSGCMGPGRTPTWRGLAQGMPGSHHRGHAETARHRHQRQVSVPHSGVPSLPMPPPALPGPLCQRPMLRSTPPPPASGARCQRPPSGCHSRPVLLGPVQSLCG